MIQGANFSKFLINLYGSMKMDWYNHGMCNINLECVFFSSRMMIIIKTYLGHWVGKKHHGSLCRERPAVAWRCACFLFVFPNSTGCFLSQRVFFFLKPHFLP